LYNNKIEDERKQKKQWKLKAAFSHLLVKKIVPNLIVRVLKLDQEIFLNKVLSSNRQV